MTTDNQTFQAILEGINEQLEMADYPNRPVMSSAQTAFGCLELPDRFGHTAVIDIHAGGVRTTIQCHKHEKTYALDLEFEDPDLFDTILKYLDDNYKDTRFSCP